MSGYQVNTPSYFSVDEPQQQLQSRTIFLQRETFQPSKTTITDLYSVTINPLALLGGYIVRSGFTASTGFIVDYTPSAEDIINNLTSFITAVNGVTAPIQSNPNWSGNKATKGMSYPVNIHNHSNLGYFILASNGVKIGGSSYIYIEPQSALQIQVLITDPTLQESYSVYIVNPTCLNNSPLPPIG